MFKNIKNYIIFIYLTVHFTHYGGKNITLVCFILKEENPFTQKLNNEWYDFIWGNIANFS